MNYTIASFQSSCLKLLLILDAAKKPESRLLPPIHAEGYKHSMNQNYSQKSNSIETTDTSASVKKSTTESTNRTQESISIKNKITELKMNNNNLKHWSQAKYSVSLVFSYLFAFSKVLKTPETIAMQVII